MDSKNKSIITRESLIGIISDKCKDDYISTEDLRELINNATDEDGVISRRRLMKSIKNYHTKSVVKDIYNVFEDVIFDVLSSADKKQDVCIKLFEGVTLDCKYIPESVKQNNLTGKTSLVESKIKPKFNITRYYCEKLNDK